MPLVGCNCDESVLALRGALEVTPAMVDFGQIPVGGEGRQELNLRNTGSFVLDIEGYETSAPFVAPTETTTIAPNRSIQVEAAFRPTEVGPVTGTLRILSDDQDAPVVEIPLVAEGIEAAVLVEPLLVDFGEVLWVTGTERQSAEVTITNPGTDSFDLTAVELTDDATGAFDVDPRSAITTFGPGDTQTIEVGYLPAAMGLASASVRLRTTAQTAPEVVVTLQGTGVGPVMEVCAGVGGNEACTAAGGTPEVDFGPVALGNMSTGAIRVLNTGDRPLTVQGQLLGSPGEIVFAPTFMSLGTFEVPAGSEQLVDVTYAPADYVFDAVNVALGANAAERPSQVVPVSGSVPRPKIEVIPRSLNFSLQQGATMSQAPVRVINCGTLDLTITQAPTLNQTTGAPGAFRMMGLPTPGTTVTPSAMCDQTAMGPMFMVIFEPSTVGSYSAEITITSDDPNEPTVTVELLGSRS